MARASSRVISWNTESEAGRLIHADHPAGFIVSLEPAPEALATVFDRGSPSIGRQIVRISQG